MPICTIFPRRARGSVPERRLRPEVPYMALAHENAGSEGRALNHTEWYRVHTSRCMNCSLPTCTVFPRRAGGSVPERRLRPEVPYMALAHENAGSEAGGSWNGTGGQKRWSRTHEASPRAGFPRRAARPLIIHRRHWPTQWSWWRFRWNVKVCTTLRIPKLAKNTTLKKISCGATLKVCPSDARGACYHRSFIYFN